MVDRKRRRRRGLGVRGVLDFQGPQFIQGRSSARVRNSRWLDHERVRLHERGGR